MYKEIMHTIDNFSEENITEIRKKILLSFISYIQANVNHHLPIRLLFICTHNSRRSHLSQVWAQTMAYHFGIKDIYCYSGGTEVTAIYPRVIETLQHEGFHIQQLSEGSNPIFAVKYDPDELPILCFSKKFKNEYNPNAEFTAIMNCSSADDDCPFVSGADARFIIQYNDPKVYDGTDLEYSKYLERSMEIGQEMWYVFKHIIT